MGRTGTRSQGPRLGIAAAAACIALTLAGCSSSAPQAPVTTTVTASPAVQDATWQGVSELGGKGGGGVDCSPGVLDGASTYCSGYCTWYVWQQRPEDDLKGLGNAGDWFKNAHDRGIPTGTQPVVGAVAWWPTIPGDKYLGEGHVAIVTAATPTSVTVSEMNALAGWNKTDTQTIQLTAANAPQGYIYGGPAAGAEYIGHIVQWDGDTKTQKTSWLVINDNGHARRNWIPSSATFYCLKGRGAPGPDVLPSTVLSNELADEKGVPAVCGGAGGTAPTSAAPAPPPPSSAPAPPSQPAQAPITQAPGPAPSHTTQAPAPSTPPPAATYTEQQGHHGVNTFTNYHNASGMGPRLDAGVYVQVSCKVYDPTISTVNPDGYWYRIASAPWNDHYYASANTFMNGDPWGGPYLHNTDMAVPNC